MIPVECEVAKAIGNPQARNTFTRVSQHWYVFWLHHKKAAWVRRALKMGASLHHRNGRRDDNRIENLEIRWPGRHPTGWTNEAMIEMLEMQGYIITDGPAD